MVVRKRQRKRIKKSGIIYFAVNNRVPNMVKIGMTIDTAEARLTQANRKNEFMIGRWEINQKVKTNDVARTEELAHQIFKEFHDPESISSEMFFLPEGFTVKKMADLVREKDKVLMKRAEETVAARNELEAAKKKLEKIEKETESLIVLPRNHDKTN